MAKSSYLKNLSKEEYYISNDGYVIFTEKYHLKRGYCCDSNCINCPYQKKKI